MSRNEPEIDLLVITGTATSDALMAADDAVTRAFRNLMELTGQPQSEPLSRDDAILRARHGVAAPFKVEPESLWFGTEEHHPDEAPGQSASAPPMASSSTSVSGSSPGTQGLSTYVMRDPSGCLTPSAPSDNRPPAGASRRTDRAHPSRRRRPT
jgi:hypothetical protein